MPAHRDGPLLVGLAASDDRRFGRARFEDRLEPSGRAPLREPVRAHTELSDARQTRDALADQEQSREGGQIVWHDEETQLCRVGVVVIKSGRRQTKSGS